MNENFQNSFDDLSTSICSCSTDSTLGNCLKRINTLEIEKDKMTFELILTKLDLINAKVPKNFDDNTKEKEISAIVEQIKEKIQLLTEKTNDQQIQLTFIDDKYTLHTTEIEQQKKKIEFFELDNQSKEEKINHLFAENKILKEEKEIKDNENKKLLEENNHFKEEFEKYKSELFELVEESDKLKDENCILSVEKSNLLKELEEYKVKISKFEEENNLSKNKFSKIKQNFEELKNENENLNDENNKLSKQLNEINLKMEKCEEDHILALTDFEKLKNENKNIFDEKSQLLNELEEYKAKISKFEEEYNLRLEKVKLKKNNEELRNENMRLLKGNDQLSMKLKEINLQMSNFQEKHNLGLTKIAIIREENKKLTNELDDSKKIISKLKIEKLQKEQEFNKKIDINKQKGFLAKIDQLKLGNSNLLKNIQEKDNEISSLKEVKQINISLTDKITTLTSDFEQLSKRYVTKVSLVRKPNKISTVRDVNTCCESKCISLSLSYSCVSGNGYVYVEGQTLIYNPKQNFDYFEAALNWEELEENENNWIFLYAQHPFNKASSYGICNSLFYFEVTMLGETYTDQFSYAAIGLDKTDASIFLCDSYHKWEDYQKFGWDNGDVFGCGIVFPTKDSLTKTYVFFTKNGFKIGKDIIIEDPNINFYPFVGLLSCSVETNFGNDLVSKPFCYNVYNHI